MAGHISFIDSLIFLGIKWTSTSKWMSHVLHGQIRVSLNLWVKCSELYGLNADICNWRNKSFCL